MTKIIPKENFKVTSIENGYSIETVSGWEIWQFLNVVFLVEIINVEQKRKQALLRSNLSGICSTYRNDRPFDNGRPFYIPGPMP